MSVDFNSVINRALEESIKRRAVVSAINSGLINPNSLEASGRSELNIEDLANAMRSRQSEKDIDNKFVSEYGKSFAIERDKKAKNSIAEGVQSKINDVKLHTDMALERQGDIAKSLKVSNQKNPYVK